MREENVFLQKNFITRKSRSETLGQRPRCVWLTGLSGSGKSTIANSLETHLFNKNQLTYLLDGDNLRFGLNKDLNFTESGRSENIRRTAEVARLMYDAGLVVIASLISPFRADRLAARNLFLERDFIEVYVSTPLCICESRDLKGLYARARSGELKNFTGIDSDYEAPLTPELTVDTGLHSVDECVNKIVEYMDKN